MAEGARLESVCILTGTQGSNPCLSAQININTTIKQVLQDEDIGQKPSEVSSKIYRLVRMLDLTF